MTAKLRTALQLLVCAGLAACASGGTTTDTPAPATPQQATGTAAEIQVMNNAPAASSYTIYIVPSAGLQTSLGVVEPQETKSFSYSASPGPYTLRAQGANGTVNSQQFRMTNTDRVTWNMQLNRVSVTARR